MVISITTTFVGDEWKTSKNEGYDIQIYSIIDPSFDIPNLNNPNVITGYLYFNLTIETFGYGLWRGSELCTAPNYIMVFPSGYTINGTTYWGTDVQPNFGNIKNSYIGFFGSTSKDILGEWGFYDSQYIHFLRDMALYWLKMVKDYGNDWANHLLDNPQTINVARAMDYGSKVMDAYSKYGINGLIQLGINAVGSAYEYLKDNPEILLKIGLSYAIEEMAGVALCGIGLTAGVAMVGAAIVASTFPVDQLFSHWTEWKKTHGTGWSSFANFMTNYVDPSNTDNLWKDWAKNCFDIAHNIVDFIGSLLSQKSWEDLYNELSQYAYNSIVGEEFHEVAFMVRDCSYGVASYDGWLFPKYHIYKAYDFQNPKYELKRLIPLPNGDCFLAPLNFDVNNLFNRPFTEYIILKTWENDYPLFSEVLENNSNSTYYVCSPYPSYIQMQLFGIPKIRLE